MSTCLTVENAQSHVTAFQPISEAARSWSDDNIICRRQSRLGVYNGVTRVLGTRGQKHWKCPLNFLEAYVA